METTATTTAKDDTMTTNERKDLQLLAVVVANYRGFAALADLAGRNGDTGLTGPRIRHLVAAYGQRYGMTYQAAEYIRGDKSNSNYFGRCGSGFGGYLPAMVMMDATMVRKIRRHLAARRAARS